MMQFLLEVMHSMYIVLAYKRIVFDSYNSQFAIASGCVKVSSYHHFLHVFNRVVI